MYFQSLESQTGLGIPLYGTDAAPRRPRWFAALTVIYLFANETVKWRIPNLHRRTFNGNLTDEVLRLKQLLMVSRETKYCKMREKSSHAAPR